MDYLDQSTFATFLSLDPRGTYHGLPGSIYHFIHSRHLTLHIFTLCASQMRLLSGFYLTLAINYWTFNNFITSQCASQLLLEAPLMDS